MTKKDDNVVPLHELDNIDRIILMAQNNPNVKKILEQVNAGTLPYTEGLELCILELGAQVEVFKRNYRGLDS